MFNLGFEFHRRFRDEWKGPECARAGVGGVTRGGTRQTRTGGPYVDEGRV